MTWRCSACERPLRLHEICETRAVTWRGEVGLYGTCCCDCHVHREQAAADVPGTVVWPWRGLHDSEHRMRRQR